MPKRISASLFHLLISFLVVSFVVAIVLFVWYPAPYFKAMGIDQMLLIMATVDITIGPVITLIIFNPAKKSLKFDLAVIGMLQFSALLYGVGVIFASRPAYVVYYNIFTVVAASDITAEAKQKAGLGLLPVMGPQLVGARMPANAKDSKEIVFSAISGKADLPQMPRYYASYGALAADVKARMMSGQTLLARYPTDMAAQQKAVIDAALAKNGVRMDDVGFVPMRAKVHDLSVMVRRTDAAIVDILPINPWGNALR